MHIKMALKCGNSLWAICSRSSPYIHYNRSTLFNLNSKVVRISHITLLNLLTCVAIYWPPGATDPLTQLMDPNGHNQWGPERGPPQPTRFVPYRPSKTPTPWPDVKISHVNQHWHNFIGADQRHLPPLQEPQSITLEVTINLSALRQAHR